MSKAEPGARRAPQRTVEVRRAPGWSDEECDRRLRQVYRWLLGLEPWPATAQAPTHVTIYGLRDPRTQQVCYVGQTHNELSHRLQQHLVEARHGRGHKNAWLRELSDAGLRPEIVALETVEPAQANCAEQRHIAAQRALGCPLVN